MKKSKGQSAGTPIAKPSRSAPTWRDASQRSRSDTAREPRTFEIHLGGLRLIVTRHINYKPDQWVAYSVPDLVGVQALDSTGIEEARLEALSLVDRVLADIRMNISLLQS